MKRIGLVTGLGPPSTVSYYLGIIDGYRARKQTKHYPEICMFNVDMERMFEYSSKGDFDKVADYFAEAVVRLKAAGATAAAICCNTLHIAMPQLLPKVPLPMISIVDATCDEIVQKGYKRVLLLATKFTMESPLYTAPLAARGVDVLLPDAERRSAIQNIIFPDLEEGIVRPEAKAKMLGMANEIIARENPDAVILGCTELPLMIGPGDLPRPLVNTTAIHVDAILDYILDYILDGDNDG